MTGDGGLFTIDATILHESNREEMSLGMWTEDGKYGVGIEGGVWAISGSGYTRILGMGTSDLI
jgi:hypothetical protein